MSSRITNVVSTVFQAHPGNTVAVMSQVRGGITSIGRASQQTNREMGLWQQQMRAVGTTLRYAFAGAAVYGTGTLIRQLKETQRQLALIGVLGGFQNIEGGADAASAALDKLYQRAQQGAFESLTPTADFNDALINLYSTIGNLGSGDTEAAVRMVEELSKSAAMAQTPVEDLTRSATGLNQAMQRPQTLGNIKQVSRSFFALTAEAPGGAAFGPQFVQQLSPLAGVASLARLNMNELFGLYLTRLKVGSTPAVAGRGLQYLLQSIAVPPSPDAAKALAQAGVTPESVQREGGYAAIQRLIAHTRGLGGADVRKIKALSGPEMDFLEESADPATAMASLGISGAGAEFMTTAIGRIHGVRAIIDLMTGNSVKNIDLIGKYSEDTAEAERLHADAWALMVKEQPLAQATLALDNMRRDVAAALEPIINIPARGIAGHMYPWLEEHPNVMKYGAPTALAAGGAYGLTRLIRGRGLGLGRLAGVGRALPAVGAGAAALTETEVGHTPLKPLYVVVVGNIFGGGGARVPPVIGGPGGAATRAGRLGRLAARFPRAARVARVGGPAAIAAGLAYEGGHYLWEGAHDDTSPNRSYLQATGDSMGHKRMQEMNRILGRPGASDRWNLNFRRARQALPGMNIQDLFGAKEVRGHVEVDVLIRHPDGRVERKRGVPVPKARWQRGTTPSNRGRPGSGR